MALKRIPAALKSRKEEKVNTLLSDHEILRKININSKKQA
jgi:hypothetical protein